MSDSVSAPRSQAGLAGFDAYQVALTFYRTVHQALRNHSRDEDVDQLLRAAAAVVRNVGEAHPQVGADRARRFRIAASEASECRAALDILEIRGEIPSGSLTLLRSLLDRANAMLWRLSRPH